MHVTRVAVLDWSAASQPKRGRDSIWLGLADAAGVACTNIATRTQAEARLSALADAALAGDGPLLVLCDLSFGYPRGFAATLTGRPDPLAVWDWLAARITDTASNAHNLRTVAATANAAFGGGGPFWGNGARAEVAGLPRRKPALPRGLAEFRASEQVARAQGLYPKSCWQLAGAGAVGAQTLVGLPVLARLRARLGRAVAVWPFQPTAGAAVVLAETYTALVDAELRAALAADAGQVRDAVQVGLLARAVHRLARDGALAPLMARPDAPELPEEGWIFGLGHASALRAALAG